MNSLKEEEKALLLKFATGSPRVPAGGFSCLQVQFNLSLFSLWGGGGVGGMHVLVCIHNILGPSIDLFLELKFFEIFPVVQGLGGPSKFTLVAMPGRDKVRSAVILKFACGRTQLVHTLYLIPVLHTYVDPPGIYVFQHAQTE